MPDRASLTPNWDRMCAVLLADPGGRGLARLAAGLPETQTATLAAAARELHQAARRVVLVTGFCILRPNRPAPETDGPAGALRLAQTLAALGREVTLLTDRLAEPVLEAGRRGLGLASVQLEILPTRLPRPPQGTPAAVGALAADDDWLRALLDRRIPTDLIAVERAGPSHTYASFLQQARLGPPPRTEFERLVPPEARDTCHNMRGISIESWTAPLHRLFELAARAGVPIRTLGIGDGGNEIGCGNLSWETIARAAPGEFGGRIACRVETDRLLLAGTSNFAAYALAAALLSLEGLSPVDLDWSPSSEQKLLETLVGAGAVDGVRSTPEPTVDGLAAALYGDTLSALLQAAAGR